MAQGIAREQLAGLLNEDLSREYQAIIACVVYSQVLKGADYMNIADQLEEHAKQDRTTSDIWLPMSMCSPLSKSAVPRQRNITIWCHNNCPNSRDASGAQDALRNFDSGRGLQ